MNIFKKFHSYWVLGICVAAFLVLWPLLKPGFIITDDGDWMIIRLSAFFQSLREGQFPVRFLGRLNNSYGYPVANFLYPGFLYIGSFIHLFGFSFEESVKIIFIGSVGGSGFLIFFWLKKYFTPWASFLGTLGFLFSPYLVFDIYKRGSVGEVLAIFAAVLVLFSIEKGIQWLIPLSVGLLIVSHNSLGLLFFLFFIGYLMVKKRIDLCLPVFIGLGLSAFFWFPAIFERKFVMFDTVAVAQPQRYFIQRQSIFLLGMVNIVAFFIVIKNNYGSGKKVRNFFLIVFALSILLATSLSAPVWMLSPVAKVFQFPYRFLSLSLIPGAWFIAQMIQQDKDSRYKRWMLPIFIILWCIPLLSMFVNITFVNRPDGFYTTNEATTTVANEYMPIWVKETPKDRAHQRMIFYQGSGRVESKILSTQKIDALIYVNEPSVIQLNSIYYPGWGITVDDQFIVPDYQNIYGLMRIPISSGKHHFVSEFRETIPRFLSDAVSIGAGIFYFCYIIWMKRNKKKVS